MARKLAVVAAALVACAPNAKLTNIQVAPENPRARIRHVLVVGIVKNPAARHSFEFEMVKALGKAGVKAEASGELLPPGTTPTREDLERLVAEKGFDAALAGMLVDSRTEVRAVPPSTAYGFYGYTTWATPVAYSPGYLETTKTIVVDTKLFRASGSNANTSAPVFSATSQTVDPNSMQDVTETLAKMVVDQLKQDGFL
jgi:hypothetical protein